MPLSYVRRGQVSAAVGSFNRTQVKALTATAFAGGGKASATPITAGVTILTTVATAADSVLLPSPRPGDSYKIINRGAAAAQVFAAGTATINGAATGTGVSLPTGDSLEVFCVTAGAYLGQIATA